MKVMWFVRVAETVLVIPRAMTAPCSFRMNYMMTHIRHFHGSNMVIHVDEYICSGMFLLHNLVYVTEATLLIRDVVAANT